MLWWTFSFVVSQPVANEVMERIRLSVRAKLLQLVVMVNVYWQKY